MSFEKTVYLRANLELGYKGQPYLVKQDDLGSVSVFAVISRRPSVNSRFGSNQDQIVYRSIKKGSNNYKAAVRAAMESE